jgi:hypothetical protein
VFDQTLFDHALFPSMHARLAMELGPAGVIPGAGPGALLNPRRPRGAAPHALVADGLQPAIDELHAAGVRAR